jgi:glucosamine-6-phosphate deaminase
MKVIKVKDFGEMSQRACSVIIDLIGEKDNPVLGLATGSTPEGLYACMIGAFRQGEVSFLNVTTFNLDEYVGLSTDDPNSYHFYMNEKLFNHIDIPSEQIHIPNGQASDLLAECQNYEQQISEEGQIDLQVLGLGLNGHIGFNEPGTSFSSRTHIMDLMESTRHANARFFKSLDEVPAKAITMGIQTIMESRMILLLVSGEKKAQALARLLNGEISEEFPASVLLRHPNVIIIADEEALMHGDALTASSK